MKLNDNFSFFYLIASWNCSISKLNFYYYLCDDTIHIDETKQENSGLPQGYFIKRQRIEQRADKKNWGAW